MSWLFKSLQSKDEVNDIHSQSSSTEESQPSNSPSSSTLIVGIRNDLAELGGSLKTGLSLLSNKFSSTLFQFQYEVGEEEEEAINDVNFNRVPGITREAVKFVDEISTRIEFWNEFPLQLPSDFRMSEVQQEHASTIERLVPRLTQLRGQLHRYMGDEQFWMLYFIFLLPRLNQHDYEILSSTQIVETRDELLRMLENKRTTEGSDNTEMNTSWGDEKSGAEERFTSSQKVSQITDATEGLVFNDEGDIKPWLNEKVVDTGLSSVDKQKRLQQDDAVSFSDLEYSDDDLSTRLSASRQRQAMISPSPSTSSDWVQLNESAQTHGRSHRARQSTSDAESSDWLKVDESD